VPATSTLLKGGTWLSVMAPSQEAPWAEEGKPPGLELGIAQEQPIKRLLSTKALEVWSSVAGIMVEHGSNLNWN
jgi:hypothetical protein